MRANCMIALFDVETVQDPATGDRTQTVVALRKVNGEKTNVGMNTFWSAAGINVNLDHSVFIRSRMYQNQKYVYMEKKLYEVFNAGNADEPVNIRLNVRQVKDNELKELIEDALELIQTPQE